MGVEGTIVILLTTPFHPCHGRLKFYLIAIWCAIVEVFDMLLVSDRKTDGQ